MAPNGDPLGRALANAVAGRRQPLDDLLSRGSRLPGTRMNAELADAFAQACRSHGARGDVVALALARLSADEAPGATAREFLPVCGLYALAARAAADASVRPRLIAEIHGRADDPRFRVRDAVVESLARIGGAAGDTLLGEVISWMDGYFHAAAVALAMGREPWLSSLHDANAVIARLDEAFALARDAPRAAARWPGYKALVEALGTAPGLIAARFGIPVFDLLAGWATVQDPVLRDVVERASSVRNLAGRFGPEIERVRGVLKASKPPPRNPDHDFGPSRDRSRSRRHGRR